MCVADCTQRRSIEWFAPTAKCASSRVGHCERDASGRAFEMLGTVQDITDRNRAEEERQASSRDLEESKAWLEEA